MAGHRDTPRSRRHTRDDYERGLPDYHDPTGGFAGARPAYSALTLRAVLAGFGLVVAVGAAVGFGLAGWAPGAVGFGVVAVIALLNLTWVLYRKRRGEPG